MTTYVFQDLTGLFHIIQSDKKATEVYADWVCSQRDLKCFAIDITDLREKLESMGVTTIQFYSCKDGFLSPVLQG